MKICLVNNLYPPVMNGGTEVVIQTTIDLLRRHGHDVVLITTTPDRPSKRWTKDIGQGFPIYRFRPKNIYYYTDGPHQPIGKKMLWHAIDIINPADAKVLKEILTIEKPDVVHGHNLKGMSYMLPSVCFKLGIPYVQTLHNYQLLHPYGTFMVGEHPPLWKPKMAAIIYQALCRRMFRTVVAVISPTKLPLSLHQQAGFFRRAKTAILLSPIAATPLGDKHPSSGKLHFVYLGALEKHKGILDLLDAVRDMQPDGWELDIYGQGSLESTVKTFCENKNNIRFKGFMSDKRALASYDALIYPSRCYETQGLAMMEALAQGTPVIAADIGSIPETIKPGVNGLLFTAGDARILRQCLASIVSDPKKIQRLRSQPVLGTNDTRLQALIDAVVAVYHQAINAKD